MVTFRDGSVHLIPQAGSFIDQLYDSYEKAFGQLSEDKQPALALIGHSFGGVIIRTLLTAPSEKDLFSGQSLSAEQRRRALYLRERVLWASSLSTPHLGSPLPKFAKDLDALVRSGEPLLQLASNDYPAIPSDISALTEIPVIEKALNKYVLDKIGGTRQSLLDIERMADYNSGLLEPSKAKHSNGDEIPYYTMAGRNPGYTLYKSPRRFLNASVLGQIHPTPNYSIRDLIVGDRFQFNSTILAINDFALAAGGYGKQPLLPWGKAIQPEGDLLSVPRPPSSLSAKKWSGIWPAIGYAGLSLLPGFLYSNGADGEYDSDGFVGWDSSNALGLAGNQWKRIFGKEWGDLFPWDWDNHETLTFNVGNGLFIYDHLVSATVPSTSPSKTIAIEVSEVRALSKWVDTANDADMRIEVDIAGTRQAYNLPDNQNEVKGKFRFEATTSSQVVPITIRLLDRDDPLSSETLSIAPEIGVDVLHLIYHVRTKKIYYLRTNTGEPPHFGNALAAESDIAVSGLESAYMRGSIKFQVTESLADPTDSGAINIGTSEVELLKTARTRYYLANTAIKNGGKVIPGEVLRGNGELKVDFTIPEKFRIPGSPATATFTFGNLTFSNLIVLEDKGVFKASGFGAKTENEARLTDLFTSQASIVLAKGAQVKLVKDSSNQLSIEISGGASTALPFNNLRGEPIKGTATLVKLNDVIGGDTFVSVRGLSLPNLSSLDGIAVPGGRLALDQIDADFRLPKQGDSTWEVRAGSGKYHATLPGVSSQNKEPLVLNLSAMKINDEGLVSFTANVDSATSKVIPLADPLNFKILVKQGQVEVANSRLASANLTVDVILPDTFQDIQGQPVRFLDSSISYRPGSSGIFLSLVSASELDIRWRGLGLKTRGGVLDLDGTRSPTGLPNQWRGLFINQGTLVLPQSLGDTELDRSITISNFQIDGSGISGAITLSTGSIKELAGFPFTLSKGSIRIRQNEIVEGALEGRLSINTGGATPTELGVKGEIEASGAASLSISNGDFSIAGMGVKLRVTSGRLEFATDVPRVFLSGDLGFESLPSPLDKIGDAKIQIRDLGFDASGNFYAPVGGWIPIPGDKSIEIGPIEVAVDQVGLESALVGGRQRLEKIVLTGSILASESLPISGGAEFGGIEIIRTNTVPMVSVRDISVSAAVPGVGAFAGRLQWGDVGDFKNTFFGSATLAVDPMGVNVGVLAMIADNAWFVSGNGVMQSGVLMAPGLSLYGLSGGFGRNVATKDISQPRVTAPSQLRLAPGQFFGQAGILIGDPAMGKAWWSDVSLNLTFPEFRLGLNGLVTVVNAEAPAFQNYNWWLQQPRTAEIKVAYDQPKRQFDLAGRLQFKHPTVALPIIEAGGEFALRVSPSEKYLRLGWEPAGQERVFIQFNGINPKIAKIRADGGLQLTFTEPMSGQLDLGMSVNLFNGRAIVKAGAQLGVYQWAQEPDQIGAYGKVYLDGIIDFELFEAAAGGVIELSFNEKPGQAPAGRTPLDTRYGGMKFNGKVYGRLGIFRGDFDFNATLISNGKATP
jgi:hypothetical protein